MKTLLIIVGIVLIAGAVYGFVNAGNGGVGVDVDVNEGGVSLDIGGSNFLGDVGDFLTDNRIVVAIVGAISLIAGLAIPATYRRV